MYQKVPLKSLVNDFDIYNNIMLFFVVYGYHVRL